MKNLFDELVALKKAYNDKLSQAGEVALKEAFKEVFEKHSKLKSVVWTQYTPYFNDGDPCRFGVNDFDVCVDSLESEEDDYTDYSYGERLYSFRNSEDEDLKKLATDVRELSRSIPKDVLEHIFGDHVKVVATREGFEITEFNHD